MFVDSANEELSKADSQNVANSRKRKKHSVDVKTVGNETLKKEKKKKKVPVISAQYLFI